jgi:KamA family protein
MPQSGTPQTHSSPTLVSGERRFEVFTKHTIGDIPQLAELPADLRHEIEVLAQILPFRVNRFVLDELVDWSAVPDDPIFRLLFPQRDMLEPKDFRLMSDAVSRGADRDDRNRIAWGIRQHLNPHPAGQMEHNVPQVDGEMLQGMQHKYQETVLFFPARGQVCHSYCTFCFRWAQFVGDVDLRFAAKEADSLRSYLSAHREVSDLLVTGGDPMVMRTHHFKDYVSSLLEPELEHVQTLRIGTKALTFWPYRFVNDRDADDLLRFFERLAKAGKHVALMAHFNHPRELEPKITQQAIRRLRDAGVTIRAQGPLLNHINADAQLWARMWRKQVQLGIIPYYMFIERDTGAKQYFELPLVKAWEIYRDAINQVSGLARTARGPSMSAHPGKVEIQGVTEVHGERVFALRMIQGRDPGWVQRPFFAKYDPEATWLDDLKPAFGEEKFFFED